MPLIKPRTRGKRLVRHITRLDHENNEALYAYAQFLGEPTDYVLNQVIDTVLVRDKEFQSWRAQHGESFAPHPGRRAQRRRQDQTMRRPHHQGASASPAVAGVHA